MDPPHEGDEALERAPTGEPSIRLTLVVPAYNEAQRLDDGLRELQATLVAGGPLDPAVTEVIVVDDGSTDGTADRAEELLAALPHHRVLRQPANAGKGAAVRAGVSRATGAAVAFTDADMSIEPAQLADLLTALETADLAIGSRSLPGRYVEYDNLVRTLMGRAFNRVVGLATDLSLTDTQCGFKAFRTPVARLLFHFGRIDRFAFDVELLYTAHRLGLTIAEVPVRWRHVSGSRIRPLRDPLSMLIDIGRRRIGLRPPAPVPAFAIEATADGAAEASKAVSAVAGTELPLVEASDGGPLLLLPLCPPEQLVTTKRALLAADGVAAVHPRWLSVTDLEALQPLGVAWGPDGLDRGIGPATPSRSEAPSAPR